VYGSVFVLKYLHLRAFTHITLTRHSFSLSHILLHELSNTHTHIHTHTHTHTGDGRSDEFVQKASNGKSYWGACKSCDPNNTYTN
jgi:hypothetical protein